MARRKLTRREVVLLGALGLVAVLVLYYGQNADTGSRVGGAAASEKDEDGPGEAPVVELALLTRGAADYDPSGRDLFKYWPRPPHPRDAFRQEQQARIQRERPKPKPVVATPPPQQATPVVRAPVQPKPNFTYLGYFGPKDNKIAVFEKNNSPDDEDPLLLARAGEVLEDRFLLKEIKFETVVLGFTEEQFKEQTTEMSMRTGSSSTSRGRGRRGRR